MDGFGRNHRFNEHQTSGVMNKHPLPGRGEALGFVDHGLSIGPRKLSDGKLETKVFARKVAQTTMQDGLHPVSVASIPMDQDVHRLMIVDFKPRGLPKHM